MQIKTFALALSLALAVFLFGERRASSPKPLPFAKVVDLTHAVGPQTPGYDDSDKFTARTVASLEKDGYFAREVTLPEHFSTHVDAPAHFARGLWTVDQIPAERLVRPLVVLELSAKARHDPDYVVSIEDIAAWETAHGHFPAGAVVIANTGWDKRWTLPAEYRNVDAQGVRHFPGYSLEAARFLAEAREAVALGIDTLSIDPGPSKDFPVHHYTLAHSLYHIENVANLDAVPTVGALAVVAPAKLEGGSGAPARVFALVE